MNDKTDFSPIPFLLPRSEIEMFSRRDCWILGINVVFVLIATFLPLLNVFDEFIMSRYGSESMPTLMTTLVWLLFANFVSIASLFALNASLGPKSGHFENFSASLKPHMPSWFSKLDEANKNNLQQEISKYKNKLDLSRNLTLILIAILLMATSIILYEIIFNTPTYTEAGAASDEILKSNKAELKVLITWLVVVTGPLYLSWMWICDALAHSGFRISRKVVEFVRSKHNPHEQSEVGHLDELDDIFKDLKVYGRLIYVVDIPLFVGVVIITVVKFLVLTDADDSYQEGFAAGAVAMHVLAANFVSLFLEKVRLQTDEDPTGPNTEAGSAQT